MFMLTFKFNRKTAVFIVIVAALVLIGIVLLVGAHHAASSVSEKKVVTIVKDDESGAAYLSQYGWEVETPAASRDAVVIPRTFSDVFSAYNELQKEQGFDLSQYCGLEAEMYTYKVLNYEGGENVVAQLYVRNGGVIGGDIHSTALDGFMVGIRTVDSGEA